MGRDNTHSQTLTLSLDGSLIGAFTPAGILWDTFQTDPIPFTAGVHTITFSTTDNSGDSTALVDSVALQSYHFIQRVSVASDGTQSVAGADNGLISGDGNVVAFVSTATKLIPGDAATNNYHPNVFVRNLSDGTTLKASLQSDGSEFPSDPVYGLFVQVLAISRTGRYVVFMDVPDAAYPCPPADIYVRDMQLSTLTRIPAGMTTRFDVCASVTADGRFVAFSSDSKSLFPKGNGQKSAAFICDTTTGAISPLSTASRSNTPVAASPIVGITDDGSKAFFSAEIKEIVPGHTSTEPGIFIKNL